MGYQNGYTQIIPGILCQMNFIILLPSENSRISHQTRNTQNLINRVYGLESKKNFTKRKTGEDRLSNDSVKPKNNTTWKPFAFTSRHSVRQESKDKNTNVVELK